jgi:hypothetical protein
MWFGDFVAIPNSQSSGGGKGGGGGPKSTSYTYQVAAMIGLADSGFGPSITEVVNGASTTYTGVRQVYVNQQVLKMADLGMGAFSGTLGQAPWAFMTTNHPTQAVGYSGVGYVAAQAYQLGSNPSMPQHSFEIIGRLHQGSSGIYDANPFAVALDLLTNPLSGVGLPAGMVVDWTNGYLSTTGIAISPAYRQQAAASDAIKKIATLSNADWVWSSGQLRFVPYALDTLTMPPVNTLIPGAAILPQTTWSPGYLGSGQVQYNLTDDDFVESGSADPVTLIRKDALDCYNCVQLTYKNRYNAYADTVVEAKDQDQIEKYGLRVMPPVDAKEICDPAIASLVAQQILQRQLYIRNTYKFRISYRYVLLDAMDIVTLTESTGSGLQGVPVRLTMVTENPDGTIDCEAEDVIGNITTAAVYQRQLPSGYNVNYNTPPGSVSPPVIFDAPARSAPSGYEVWLAVAGSAPALWGGCFVWVSTDGSNYKTIGRISAPARYGALVAAINAVADPDTTSTISVDLTASAAVLNGGSVADADALNTLCWLDGELIAYSGALLTATSKYSLIGYTRRGQFGTGSSAHATGAKFARLDGGIFKYAYDPSLVGKQIFFKFTSVNIWGAGAEGLAAVPAYTYTIGGPIGAPGDVTTATSSIVSGGIQLNWTPVTTPKVVGYEVRIGASWATATRVALASGTAYTLPFGSGANTYLVKAFDSTGRYSLNAAAVTVSVTSPSQPTVTQQVVDNNVLLYWTASTCTQPIKTYQISKGATYAASLSNIIGQKSGLFTSVFETAAGSYTYWVVGIDAAGNFGTPASVTATVNAPPDYILKANLNSTFTGTMTNALYDPGAGGVVLPVDTTTSYAAHFTNSAWASPQDQINAGFPIYIEKSVASGSYQENIDYGSILPGSKITVTLTGTVIAGAPNPSFTIQTSPDNVTFTTFTGVSSVYQTNFRYIRILVTATSSAGADLYVITGLNVRLDIKLKNDAGSVNALSTDTAGTQVNFGQSFTSVTSITLTAGQTTTTGAVGLVPIYIFNGAANPVGFQVMLYNSAGARVSGTVSWSAKGY